MHASGPLHGTVRAGGAKNSALKLMAACLLCEGRHVLSGMPEITDVAIMAEVFERDRCEREEGDRPGEIVIETPPDLVPEAPYHLVEKMRASIVVLGPPARAQRRAQSLHAGGR